MGSSLANRLHFSGVFLLSRPGAFWFLCGVILMMGCRESEPRATPAEAASVQKEWIAPSLYLDNTLEGEERALVIYGEELIANTSRYLGPRGVVKAVTNGMNCQNCHLNAGTKPWGNNYGGVHANYPKYRERSGTRESVYKRISDCMERSLNGHPLDSNSREMRAMVAYIHWIGSGVAKGVTPEGTGIVTPKYLDRPASPEKGRLIYATKCQNCHGANGEGQMNPDGLSYSFPPLWGEHSYNNGAGLFRLSRLAGYIRDNMPFNQSAHESPALTDAECWDVAAFINSQPRPQKDLSKDWPDISKKPVDHPYGPFTDGFSEPQHKYGPFPPIIAARKTSH